MKNKIVLCTIMICSIVCTTSFLNTNDAPSFIIKKDVKKKNVKHVEEKVITTAHNVFDMIADVISDLSQWGKSLSDTVFKRLQENNKEELHKLLHRLELCQKELLEIQKKIDTLT